MKCSRMRILGVLTRLFAAHSSRFHSIACLAVIVLSAAVVSAAPPIAVTNSDDAGDGDIDLTLLRVQANNNAEDNIKTTEEDGGDVHVSLKKSVIGGSANNDGVQFEEIGDGDIYVSIVKTLIADNDGAGVAVSEEDAGAGDLLLQDVTLLGNDDPQVDLDGDVVLK